MFILFVWPVSNNLSVSLQCFLSHLLCSKLHKCVPWISTRAVHDQRDSILQNVQSWKSRLWIRLQSTEFIKECCVRFLPEKNWTTSCSVQEKGRPRMRTTPSWLSPLPFSMASASLLVTSYTVTKNIIPPYPLAADVILNTVGKRNIHLYNLLLLVLLKFLCFHMYLVKWLLLPST